MLTHFSKPGRGNIIPLVNPKVSIREAHLSSIADIFLDPTFVSIICIEVLNPKHQVAKNVQFVAAFSCKLLLYISYC